MINFFWLFSKILRVVFYATLGFLSLTSFAIPLCFADENITIPVQEYHLKNGLTLLVMENHRAPVVVLQMWYQVGSKDEVPGKTGLAHALEHMMFQGTTQFPNNAFIENVTKIGGLLNAATDNDYTYYYEEASVDQLPLLLKLEADRMANLNINAKAFNREIEVVKEERRLRTENNPQALTMERFNDIALPGSPYQHPGVGWMRDLNQMTLQDVQQWYLTWYAPNNATLVVVGDVIPEKVKALTETYFAAIPAKTLPIRKSFSDVPEIAQRQITLKLPAQLPWLLMGYNVPSLKTAANPKDAYALYLLAGILSEGNSSRFMVNIIQGQHVASEADAHYSIFSRWPQLFLIEGTPAKGHDLKELQQAFLNELNKLRNEPVSADELKRLKIQVEAFHIYRQDSLIEQATLLGNLYSVGLPWQLSNQFVAKLEEITPQDIQRVVKTYFIPERLSIALMYPQQPKPSRLTPQNMIQKPQALTQGGIS